MRTAIIDLGTNSVRLLIVESFENSQKPVVIFQRKEMIQLGVGLFTSGDFTKEARERAIAAFKDFQREINRFSADRTIGVATCAMREAKSGLSLRDAIQAETGISLTIISGEEEASLIAQGVLSGLGALPERGALIDIGGGSTEISYITGTSIEFSTSTPLGAVRGQEIFLKQVPPESGGEEELRKFIREVIEKSLPRELLTPITTLYGSSGSVRSVLKITLALLGQTTSGEGPLTIETRGLESLIARMQTAPLDELLNLPTLEPKRAKVIFAAAIILEELSILLKAKYIQAVPWSLKEGLMARYCTPTIS